jgi:DNA-binding CsgD family transcriptional regulator
LPRGADFTDGQLEPAAAVQPLWMLVDRHVTAHGALSPAHPGQVAECGLTGRETAVLRLLSKGLSAGAMARRLACSPRTVEKHIEHVYRKLGCATASRPRGLPRS